MVDYIFFDGTTYVKVRTDAVDLNTNRFTIMEVADAPGGYYSLSAALQKAFGRNLDQLVTTKADLAALAATLSYGLQAFAVGQAGNVSGTTISTTPFTTVTGFTGATGSGAAGTDHLTWTAVSNATNYVIDRATNVGFTTGVVLGVYSGPLLVFNDSGLTPSTQYFYRIRAQNPFYADSATAAASATTHA